MKSLAVFAAALVILGWNIWNAGVASGYVDPLGRIGAQDEAIYGSEAIAMATGQGWLTQTFMHRWEMSKPPLLMWMTLIAFKAAGVTRVALRAPSLLCGALLAALLFGFVARSRGSLAGVAAALLFVSNPLVFTLARHALTDIVVAAATVAAIILFLRDTRMSRWPTVAGIGAAIAAAMLAKSLLGILPLVVIVLAALFLEREDCPPIARVILVAGLAVVLAAPWFIYQLATHRAYFLAEMSVIYGQAQGLRPQQTSETALGYYAARLAVLDPALAVLAVTGLFGLSRALRRRDSAAVTVLCWIAVFGAVLLGFGFRSAPYLLPVVPAFILLAALWSPLFGARAVAPALVILIALFTFKAVYGERTWGLAFGGSEIATAPVLQRYCEMRRPTDLIIFDAGDQFYGATLPLAHARYAWIESSGVSFALNPHLHYLGILLTGEEFAALPDRLREYESRMGAWHMTSTEAVGTGLGLRNAAELQDLVDARPGSDFLLPAGAAHSQAHDIGAADTSHVYLLARHASGAYVPKSGWSCRF